MQLQDALDGVEVVRAAHGLAQVRGVQYDSRRVRAGDMFCAMHGGSTDGNRFVDAAIGRGAAAIVTDSQEVWAAGTGVPSALVASGRRALATIAANLHGHPERSLKVTAVTGTNGKTTTTLLLEQLLKAAGRRSVVIGTIETRIGETIQPSTHTTPEASDLMQIFADGVAAGCTEVVMEMSSHALEQERVWGVPVDVAVFTNLTQDHLDYHRTMAAYGAAKAKLFEGVGAAAPRVAVVNTDDEFGRELVRQAGSRSQECILYGLGSVTPASVSEIRYGAGRTSFLWHIRGEQVRMESPLTGKVNVYNLLAASLAALARGVALETIVSAARGLRQVPGRFQTVPNGRGITVVVDYAHTEDALRNLIGAARELVGSGRIITMFGCGGDRDRTKRAKMGRAAGEGSDLVVLTSDNPRSEDPSLILAEALAGVRETAARCTVEADRAKAIELAIGQAKVGDIVLLAGKGHEKVQVLRTETIAFDDVAVAAAVLA